MEPHYGETYEEVKLNKGLCKIYTTLFVVSLSTMLLSIISSEHISHFEIRMGKPVMQAPIAPLDPVESQEKIELPEQEITREEAPKQDG